LYSAYLASPSRGTPGLLAVDSLNVHRAIAAAPRIRLRIVLHNVVAPQFIEGNADQRRRVKEQIFSALLLADEAKTTVGNACNCTL